jgi:hypothetical protein
MDGNSIVQYYPLQERINISALSVEPNNTADNNDRKPQDSQERKPVTSTIYIDPETFITVRDIVKSDMKYKISEDKTKEVKATLRYLLDIWKGIGER